MDTPSNDKRTVKSMNPLAIVDAKFINDTKLININNKDLLLVSLLEYVCSIHDKSNKTFTLICEYLKENGIIEKNDVYSLDSSYLRDIYIKMIRTLLIPAAPPLKQIEYDKKAIPEFKDFYASRYNSDFIEIEPLGKGGFGSVYKAYNKLDQTIYAIKKVPIKKLNDEKSNFYLNEVRHLSMLNHENIVRYYTTWIDFSEYNDTDEEEYEEEEDAESKDGELHVVPTLFIQMELCCLSLCEYLEDRNYQGSMSPEDCLIEAHEIFMQIVDGVRFIHENGIIHRDLSTKNIFLNYPMKNRKMIMDSDSPSIGLELPKVKIGDFGLSQRGGPDNVMGIVDDSYGNLTYMSPEELEDGQYSYKSDIYSLGIIYLELMIPFKTMMERSIIIQSLKDKEWGKFESLPAEDLRLIKWMTENDYKERPTIHDVHDNLFYT